MTLLDIVLTIGYVILAVFVLILVYYTIRFLRGFYRRVDRFFHPTKKFLNRKRLMGDLTKKYGKSKAKQIFVEIREELRKTGVK